MKHRFYLCIDLKSFYASVECAERGLDAMTANLVVADPKRDRGTVCLAVSPAMRKLGVRNRCRVYEIPANLKYIMAPPRMKLYMDYSAEIYGIYLKYISKEDIFVYSIDEAFLDVTDYLNLYQMTPQELGRRIMADIQDTLHIRAACGVGTNLYLSKIALDIVAKHSVDHIGYLDEESYRRRLWDHRPITDFWRVGPGISKRLENVGIHTMRDIAQTQESFLYRLFGVDAEYLIDHAWGREPTTIEEIKQYKSRHPSLSSGQVLLRDYGYEEGLLVVKEMVDLLCLDLVEKHLVTDFVSLYVGYSKDAVPSSYGSSALSVTTNSVRLLTESFTGLYRRLVNPLAAIRKVTISFHRVVEESYEQYDLFTTPQELERDRNIQKAVLDIKRRFGKNAILRGMDLQKAATTRERNGQIGGHRSGIS